MYINNGTRKESIGTPPPDTDLCKQIDLLHAEAEQLYEQENFPKSLEICHKADELLVSLDNESKPYLAGQVDNLVLTGINTANHRNAAIDCFLKALSLLTTIGYVTREIDALDGLCWAYFRVGDYGSAKGYLEKAIALAERSQDPYRLAKVYDSAAVLLSETNETDRAIQYSRHNLDYYKETGDTKRFCAASNNLAMIFVDQGDFARAEGIVLGCLDRIKDGNYPLSESSMLDTLGLACSGQGRLEEAVSYFRQSYQCLLKINHNDMQLEPQLHLAGALIQLGNVDQAEQIILSASQVCDDLGALHYKAQCYERLSEINALRGDYKQALLNYQEFHVLKEKIQNQHSLQQLADLLSAHKMEQAHRDAEMLRVRNRNLSREIETVKQRQSELSNLVITDPLTGLSNRRYLDEIGPLMFTDIRKQDDALTVAMIDVDNFKEINDTYGHGTGDRLLVEIGARLRSSTRQEDVCCRYGGDEFLLIFPQLDLETGRNIVSRICANIHEIEIETHGQLIPVAVSGGVTSIHNGDTCVVDIIQRADRALLKAKASGRNVILCE